MKTDKELLDKLKKLNESIEDFLDRMDMSEADEEADTKEDRKCSH